MFIMHREVKTSDIDFYVNQYLIYYIHIRRLNASLNFRDVVFPLFLVFFEFEDAFLYIY